MALRYFKATDGMTTVFRASSSHVYRSAGYGAHGAHFSDADGLWPVVEITRPEFVALLHAKYRRVGAGDESHSASRHSWVLNSTLAA